MNELILRYVPDFLESNFKSFVDNVFMQIHLAQTTSCLEKVRHFVSNDIYENLIREVEDLKNQGLRQVYDELNVKQTKLLGARLDNGSLLIDVHLTSRYLDYLVDNKGKYVKGNRDIRVQKENYLTFARKLSAKKSFMVKKCPGCGAMIDVNRNGKCVYCDTIYDLEDNGWILVSLEVR